jgi:hypothetical protein
MDLAVLTFATTAVAVAITAVGAQLIRGRLRGRRGELVDLAEKLGGRYLDAPLGDPGSVRLERPVGSLILKPDLDGDPTSGVLLELRLPWLLPALSIAPGQQQSGLVSKLRGQDIQVGHPGLDGDFRIRAPDEEAARLMLRGEAIQAVRALATDERWGSLRVELEPDDDADGSRLRVTRGRWLDAPEAVKALVDTTCELGRALVEQWQAPWLASAARWGLRLSHKGLRYSMQGTADGLPLRVRHRERDGRAVTVIQLTLPTLPGLHVAHRDHARRAGWLPLAEPVGNAVLDMTLAVKAKDPAQARALLADEALTADLIELVHGFPGSELHQQGLELLLPGHVHVDLEELIEGALALARELRARLAATGALVPPG